MWQPAVVELYDNRLLPLAGQEYRFAYQFRLRGIEKAGPLSGELAAALKESNRLSVLSRQGPGDNCNAEG